LRFLETAIPVPEDEKPKGVEDDEHGREVKRVNRSQFGSFIFF